MRNNSLIKNSVYIILHVCTTNKLYFILYTNLYRHTHKNIFKIANETSGLLHLYTGFLTFNWHQYNFPSFNPSTSSEYPSFLITVHVSRVGAILQLRRRRFFTPHTQIVTKYDHTTYKMRVSWTSSITILPLCFGDTHTYIYFLYLYISHMYILKRDKLIWLGHILFTMQRLRNTISECWNKMLHRIQE